MNMKKLLATTMLIFLSGLAAAGPEKEEAKGDFIKGLKLWKVTCNRCHNMRDPSEFSDGEWHIMARHMRIRAGLSGQDERDILTYLKQSNNR
ncbi:MAG: hypothetical protein OQK12_11805 [Motiliproteus sp.]|nr:hypothetical protein [Motiliproteus sp.]MCW9051608.1 hypothetical protein [Motiliproteus sp.]